MNKKCIGCGVVLQNSDENSLGYVKDLKMEMCMRCFKLKHYHEIPKKAEISTQLLIQEMKGKKGISFFFVDVLEISREAISYFQELSEPRVLVVSKCDVLPKSISLNKIEKWIRKTFKIDSKIIFTFKNSLSSLKKVRDIIIDNPGKKYYFWGMTNAGKSTFLNAFLKFIDDKESLIVESELPNTTLDFININSSLGTLVDSAGIYYAFAIENAEFLEKCQSKKAIKERIYPLKKGSRLLIEDKIELEAKEDSQVVCLCSNHLNIKKVYNETILANKISLSIKEKSHLLIKGVGIFYFKYGVEMNVYGLSAESLEVLPSFMGGFYE